MERLIGYLGITPLKYLLSFQLMETNTKSGNLGPNHRLLNL